MTSKFLPCLTLAAFCLATPALAQGASPEDTLAYRLVREVCEAGGSDEPASTTLTADDIKVLEKARWSGTTGATQTHTIAKLVDKTEGQCARAGKSVIRMRTRLANWRLDGDRVVREPYQMER